MTLHSVLNFGRFIMDTMEDPAAQIEMQARSLVEPINNAIDLGDSDIQRFYDNKTVFITGGTGFLGKHLIEKLFRSCDIKKAFILIRFKKNETAQERLKAILDDPVFESLLKRKPNLAQKLFCIEGDMAELKLGICNDDWTTITKETDIVFHLAATIRFDEAIRTATLVNIRGTREILALAKQCIKLCCYVHVSTAYCNATSTHTGQNVLEQFYNCPVNPNTIINMAETMDNELLNGITNNLIGPWPNTYAFTKAISEHLVKAEIGNMPICVVRPSIVLCSYKDPLPGWLDMSCIFGPSGIVFGVGLGFLRVLHVNSYQKISFVPIDYVTNATIAAAWDTSSHHNDRIYHISTTNSCVTFKHVSNPLRTIGREVVTNKALWYSYLVEANNITLYKILAWILHYIPAYIVDFIIKVFKMKLPKGMKSFVHIYSKYDKQCEVFKFFLTNEWNFDDENLVRLRERMSERDKIIFDVDSKDVDWNQFTLFWAIGVRKYLLKDGLKDTKKAIKKQNIFKYFNHIYVIGWIVLVFYVFYCILSLILNYFV